MSRLSAWCLALVQNNNNRCHAGDSFPLILPDQNFKTDV